MTDIQGRILACLPATPVELATELYGYSDKWTRNAIHVHVHFLRQHIEVQSIKRTPDFYDDDRSRIMYTLEE